METSIVQQAKEYVEKFFEDSMPTSLVYHNLQHTQEMIESIREIGEAEGLSEEEMEIAQLAGWFHDTGFAFQYGGHEKASAELADTFLRDHDYPDEKIATVKQAILTTHLANIPETKIGKVVRDADTLHVGKSEFKEKMQALRKELNAVGSEEVNEEDFLKETISFYNNHTFHTDYAERQYSPVKEANIKKLKLLAEEKGVDIPKDQTKKEGKKKQKKDLERGIQTMFRNTIRTHIDLSAIADNKANIMLSVNAILLSILVANLVPTLDTKIHLILPTFLLVLVCVVSLVFAILAVRPSVTGGKFTKQDIENKTANLLYFGNFHSMEFDDFEWGMWEMMADRDFLYNSMIRDFYHLGKVLAQKYSYLRICYNIFMAGISLSAIVFMIALFWQGW